MVVSKEITTVIDWYTNICKGVSMLTMKSTNNKILEILNDGCTLDSYLENYNTKFKYAINYSKNGVVGILKFNV